VPGASGYGQESYLRAEEDEEAVYCQHEAATARDAGETTAAYRPLSVHRQVCIYSAYYRETAVSELTNE